MVCWGCFEEWVRVAVEEGVFAVVGGVIAGSGLDGGGVLAWITFYGGDFARCVRGDWRTGSGELRPSVCRG